MTKLTSKNQKLEFAVMVYVKQKKTLLKYVNEININ